MASYELVFKKSVAKDFRSIPKKDVARILERIEALREYPRGEGCVKLSAQQERYRVRQGIYRIVYEIQDNELIVIVVKVAYRSSIYRNS
ncbi:MAG: type II toxin-antitoxin system RelE/ParE family toxin [Gammaproteobacteria bacterium]|nr:type II toxin-antitoxin system RelE/ParE family toxin [Gammaproteobacteria bacterium]